VASKGYKWKNIIKPIWNNEKTKEKAKWEQEKAKRDQKRKGAGTIFLPRNPNALVERPELLFASKLAGNTGVRNEILVISEERLRQKVISRDDYKNLMLTLNN